MQSLRLMFLMAAVGLMAGCSAPWHPPSGILYTSAGGVNPSTSVVASDGVRSGARSGKACATGFLGLVSTGDMSVQAAKSSAGITRVDTLDYETTSILFGIFVSNCTVVTGE